jgi:hypothetical protein
MELSRITHNTGNPDWSRLIQWLDYLYIYWNIQYEQPMFLIHRRHFSLSSLVTFHACMFVFDSDILLLYWHFHFQHFLRSELQHLMIRRRRWFFVIGHSVLTYCVDIDSAFMYMTWCIQNPKPERHTTYSNDRDRSSTWTFACFMLNSSSIFDNAGIFISWNMMRQDTERKVHAIDNSE